MTETEKLECKSYFPEQSYEFDSVYDSCRTHQRQYRECIIAKDAEITRLHAENERLVTQNIHFARFIDRLPHIPEANTLEEYRLRVEARLVIAKGKGGRP